MTAPSASRPADPRAARLHALRQARALTWAGASDGPLIDGGNGAAVVDVDGKRYLDGTGGNLAALHGHRRPEIEHAVGQALLQMACGPGEMAGAAAVELSEKLVALAPAGLDRVLLCASGNAARSAAAQAAQAATGREEVLELGGPGLPHPHCFRCPLGKSFPSCGLACADEVAGTVRERRRRAAALLVETSLVGPALARPPAGWLARLAAACERHEVLLVADETADGLGRSGALFACEREGVVPDLLVVGDSLGGGYAPIGAVLAGREVAAASPELARREPPGALACAAALGNLFVLATNRTLDKVAAVIDALGERLVALSQHRFVGEARHRGLRAAVELVQDKASRSPFPAEEQRGCRVAAEARARGLLVQAQGDVVAFAPPLTTTEDELADMLSRLTEAVDAGTR